MRVFFALELPAEMARQAADWRDRQLATAGRPVPCANLHITLAFVGELKPGPLERLCLAVDDWLAKAQVRGAELTLDRTGYWPRPGIYWLGPTQWPDSLSLLAAKLRAFSVAAGARRDRKSFQPHITLLRRCDEAPPAPVTIPAFNFAYSHFTLFESRQGKSGVSYHPLQDWEIIPD